MLRTLSGRLALLLFCALCAIVAAYGVLTFRGSQVHLDEANQKLNRDLARYLVDANKLVRGDSVNQRALAKLFANLMSVNPNIEIYLLDDDGTILTYSAAENRVKRTSVDLVPVREFLTGRAMFPLMGDDPRDPSRRKVFSAAPLPLQGNPEAYLYVVLGGEEYDSVANMLLESRLLRTNLQVGALAAGFLILAWFLLFWSITRRLRRLNARVEQFRRGPLAADMPAAASSPAAGDEIDQLDITFTQMAQRIARQVDDMKQTDQVRRDLIANVSHDLRTPLTALHGYIETLLIKGAELSPAQQREYLETAARSSQRLNKLVSELFELAKLESRAAPLEPEVFSLADLVQDVVGEFQLVAEQHGVLLRTRIDADLAPVLGDIRMIERVLDNLLQNAIQHTPANGDVTVHAAREAEAVTVSVSDTGCGIPQDDLPYIFDRFYKARNVEGENAQGAGLGLAIAKRILEMHGTKIHAESVLNVGTTFTFSLATTAFPPDPSDPTSSAAIPMT
ncbi:MAG: HAMP domain-containing histidine kinase [Burkholderiaceae bacterium]|nr:HAMP domain-containing histidine kinase [Burkholderiaceae bacterium]